MDVADPLTWVILASALVAMATAILHLYGWLPQRYTARLREVQIGLAANIGSEVEKAFFRVSEAQATKFKAEADAAQAAFVAEQAGQVKSAEMSMIRSVGVDKQMRAKLDSAMAEAILGPAMPLLRQFVPGLADLLEENPQMVEMVINHPLFKKYVEPRIAAFLGSQSSPSSPPETGRNPFLEGMGP